MKKTLCFIITLACASLASHALALTYTVLDLGTLGGNFTLPIDINNSGHVVGYSQTLSGVNHAFLMMEQCTILVHLEA